MVRIIPDLSSNLRRKAGKALTGRDDFEDPVPRIDMHRLRGLLDGVNAHGRNASTGGFDRIGFSDADMDCRRWFADVMGADGLAVTTDAAGNVFGRLGPPDRPCVMAGSHLDTVPSGGAFDGALGVCIALECVRALRDAGCALSVPIEVAAFSEEEGRFGGMLGSQAVAGTLAPGWADAAVNSEGVRLVDAMRAQGLDPSALSGAARQPGSVLAFLELHIEQGPELEAAGVPLGVARSISGVGVLAARLEGRSNHSGTTPMRLRADAFAGLATVAAGVPSLIAAYGGPETRVTIGRVLVEPNFPHTIPGIAEFSIVLRDPDEKHMRSIEAALRARIKEAAGLHGLSARVAKMSWLSPVALDPGLAALVRAEADRLGVPSREMASGAGHDAQTMQGLCPSALIFVPSRGGISHSPEEWTDWADIEQGAAVMLAALARLAGAA